MRSGRRGTFTAKIGRRTERRLALGVRRVTAVGVVLGVLAWAVLPASSFPIDQDAGATTCRMACADTPSCCCKPAATADEPKHDRSSGAELSTPATRESCPRDCATRTVVPGTSTARSAQGVHRLATPEGNETLLAVDIIVAIQQELFDVARPRGPPAQEREDLSPARVPPNTPGSCASLLGRFSAKTRAGSGSSESRHSSVRHFIQTSFNVFEPRVSSLSTTLASRCSKEPTGVDANHHGGTHE
jgi:hypothetical protein